MPRSTPKHKVVLSDDQRAELERVTRQSSIGVARKRWATILLLADEAHPEGQRTDAYIAAQVQVSVRQLERIRKKFVQGGMDRTLTRATRRDAGVPQVLDGQAEAHLVTLCCSDPPTGRERWTLQLLCDELVRLQVVTHVCPETVRTCLKKAMPASLTGGPGFPGF
ncbi:helix-turn-helix domain-containing protein [Gemmata sp. G18]|uniref:Helix-turn-helix domain-containing protein n=1 Tax=Gemmata palustris TaxID=2822762 RepID=A0ABS5BT58_9BACT|nr:helix-turn-helix domain-containing protein [Gemmata palustris]MBP3956901.1 helix-turn-helix domain-containing protein [Gemmata palustris]